MVVHLRAPRYLSAAEEQAKLCVGNGALPSAVTQGKVDSLKELIGCDVYTCMYARSR